MAAHEQAHLHLVLAPNGPVHAIYSIFFNVCAKSCTAVLQDWQRSSWMCIKGLQQLLAGMHESLNA